MYKQHLMKSSKKIMPLTFYGTSKAYFDQENVPSRNYQLLLGKARLGEPARQNVGCINGINLINNRCE
jgi:hypothetical protein